MGNGNTGFGGFDTGAYAGLSEGAVQAEGNGGQATSFAAGHQALNSTSSGAQDVAVGYQALQNSSTTSPDGPSYGDGSNTALGAYAMQGGTGGVTSGANTAVGSQALQSTTRGQQNTAIGAEALLNLQGALSATSDNTAIGMQAMYAATTAESCTAVGIQAMGGGATIGQGNTAVGDYSLWSLDGDGGFNAALGHYAGYAVTSGAGNVIVGDQAAYNGGTNPLTTGSFNVFIGVVAGLSSATQTSGAVAIGHASGVGGDYAIAIGSAATAGAAGAVAIGTDHTGAGAAASSQDEIVIGTSLHSTILPGTFAAGTGVAAPTLAATGNLGTSPPAPTLKSGSTAVRGTIEFGTGSGTVAIGDAVAVTIPAGLFASAPTVLVAPASYQTAPLGPYVDDSTVTATGFSIGLGVAPTASQPVGTYKVNYWVVG